MTSGPYFWTILWLRVPGSTACKHCCRWRSFNCLPNY